MRCMPQWRMDSGRKVKSNENSQIDVATLVASVEKDQQDGLCPIPHFNHWLHTKTRVASIWMRPQTSLHHRTCRCMFKWCPWRVSRIVPVVQVAHEKIGLRGQRFLEHAQMTFPDWGAVAWSSYGRSVFLPTVSPAMASTFGDGAEEATLNLNF